MKISNADFEKFLALKKSGKVKKDNVYELSNISGLSEHQLYYIMKYFGLVYEEYIASKKEKLYS